jgi:hypothetical protein
MPVIIRHGHISNSNQAKKASSDNGKKKHASATQVSCKRDLITTRCEVVKGSLYADAAPLTRLIPFKTDCS